MAVLQRTVTASVADFDTSTITNLDVVSATVRRDERAIPIQVLDLVIATPSDAIFALLEPGTNRIVTVGSTNVADNLASGAWWGQVDDVTRQTDGTARVTIASADRRLLDWTPTAVDRTCWTMQDDVEKIWNYVLGRVFPVGYSRIYSSPVDVNVGGDSGPSRVPVPFPTYSAVTNNIPNPGFEAGIQTWNTNTSTTLSQSSDWAASGSYSMKVVPSRSSTGSQAQLDNVSLQPNTTYTFRAKFRMGSQVHGSGASGNARSLWVGVAVGGSSSQIAKSNAGTNVANATSDLSVTFTTPAYFDSVSLYATNGAPATSNYANYVVYFDEFMLLEGDGTDTDGVTPVPFFDGNTVDGTRGYNYDWSGTAGQAASTRTPIIQRDPDVLTWSPGQSAWEFLEPIMQTFGFRTVASPTWSYSQSAGHAVPSFGFVTSAYSGRQPSILYFSEGINLYGIDTGRSRTATFPDGTPLFADAVILRYSWTDAFGVEQVQYDTYAPAAYNRPYYLELEQPFPGAGRAQSLYKRLVARRRTVTVTGRLSITADPGTQVAITSRELGGAVFAYADTVEHDLIQGTTTITTKAAIDYPTSAWLRLPAGDSWNASPTGASWTAETIS